MLQEYSTLAEYIFWLVTEKTYLMVKDLGGKFVFWYFYILVLSVTKFWRNIFVLHLHDVKPLVPLVSKYYLGHVRQV